LRRLIKTKSPTNFYATEFVLLTIVNYPLWERLASAEKIGKYHGPVFISHSQTDKTIPFWQGKKLFDTANEPKTFYIPPPGYDYHSAPHCPEHQEKLRQFIDSLPR
jgi:fermentation-respiration switch protein FrsA (DUF1100 family)